MSQTRRELRQWLRDARIVGAPMAGGGSTPGLARAVIAADGLPFLAAGYKTVDAIAAQVSEVASTRRPFGVNVFVPQSRYIDTGALAEYAEELHDEFAAHGLEPDSTLVHDDDGWEAKIAWLIAHPVPIVSFTFGLPDASIIRQLQDVDTSVLVSVTTPEEAIASVDAGVDGLVVQAPAAGGHSATFDPTRTISPIETAEVAARVRDAVPVPLIAGGGLDGASAVRDVQDAGADAAVVGTLLLRTDESGASAAHRAALADSLFEETTITTAFTGRPARALRSGFIDRHRTAPVGYPEIHHLTKPLRDAAARAGDLDRVHLWAGTGWRAARTGSASAVIAELRAGAVRRRSF